MLDWRAEVVFPWEKIIDPIPVYMRQKHLGQNVFRKTSRRSGVFIVNFEHISHLLIVFLLLTLNN